MRATTIEHGVPTLKVLFATLGWSRAAYVEFCNDEKVETLIAAWRAGCARWRTRVCTQRPARCRRSGLPSRRPGLAHCRRLTAGDPCGRRRAPEHAGFALASKCIVEAPNSNIMDVMTNSNWLATFPGLKKLAPDIAKPLIETSKVTRLHAGTRIFGPGEVPEAYLLFLKGTVRVQQASETGREIVLYRVSAGESCALTMACLMGHDAYQAEGIAETDVEAVAIPRATFDDLIARSPLFRRFVFTAFSARIMNLLRVIRDIAFSRIDVRLAQRLLELSADAGHIEITHLQLAAELGTAREVVSRQLNEFQRRGWISTSRGAIEVVNSDGLRQLAAGALRL